MIKEAIYYEMYCDRCGAQLDDGDIVAYKEREGLEFVASESEWQTINGKHYCPDCYELDEETDEYVPKKGDKKMSKTIHCGECEHFDPDCDPYGLFDGYCDLYGRGRNKNSECYGR